MAKNRADSNNPIRTVAGMTVQEFSHELGPCQIGECGRCSGVGKNGDRAEIKFFTCPHSCHGETEPERFEELSERVESRVRVVEESSSEGGGTSRPKKKAGHCQCGCGGMTKGGRFLPGHDAKLKSALRKRANDGDQDAINELAERGW